MTVNLGAIGKIPIPDDQPVSKIVREYFATEGVVNADQGAMANAIVILLAVSQLEGRLNKVMSELNLTWGEEGELEETLELIRSGQLSAGN